MKIVARNFIGALPKVAIFGDLYGMAIDDLRDFLDRSLARGAGNGEHRQDILDELLFQGGVLPNTTSRTASSSDRICISPQESKNY